jgi:Concanavalin A-like lectin/glucanases superfamily/Bacterial Ig-like domain
MQRLLFLTLVVAVVGCSDDGRNKTVPDTALVEVPDPLTNQRHVRILFEAKGNANGFQCTLDGQTSQCISPFEADVADGEHAFAVAAALNDNVDETPAMHAWKVDSVTPETTITSAPPTLDNAVAPVFTFTGSDPGGDTLGFECAIDEGAFTTCSSPHTVNSADGLHSFQVRAKDRAGNVDPTPAIHGWTIDATAPDTMITTGPAAGATTGITGSFGFSSPDASATFECALDGTTFAACTSPFSYVLGNGMHSFLVRAKDQVGIVDPSPASRSWNVDAVGPTTSITSTPAVLTNVATPVFAFTANETATFECQIDGVVNFTACTSPWTGPAVTDGGRNFRIRATDGFGNLGAAVAFVWTVDTAPPSVTFAATPLALSNDITPTAVFTASGATGTMCRVDAGTLAACTSPFSAVVMVDGAHTISVVATDAPGNLATATTPSFTIDTTPPSLTFTVLPLALSNDTTPTVEFTTAGGATTIECRVDTGVFAACASPHTATVAQGAHTFGVRVTDAAGNSGNFATASFTVDTTPPTVTITSQPPALSNNNDPVVAFTLGGGGMSPTCQLDAGAPVACTSPHTFANASDGSHTITVRAVDAATNTGSATTGSFTVDTVGPAVAFVEQAPAAWPVNYFDFAFTAGDSATVQCAIDTGAFASCASPFSATVSYNTAHTVSVRGTDSAGNPTTITSTAFTPVAGQVLHYPWEQGSTENTSLLRQRPSHSPNGPAAGLSAFVGGWAGSALGNAVTAHTYPKTPRVLSSSPNGNYTASFWIRPRDAANGTIFSTATGTNGLRVSLSGGTQLTFVALEAGQSTQFTTAIPTEQWTFVSLRTLGPATGLDVFINGMMRGTVATLSGFVPAQNDLVVGSWNLADVDDLRFYNRAFTNDEHCLLLGRGFKDANGGCHPLAPGFEIDFEGRVVDTGIWNLALGAPTGGFVFSAATLGQLFHLTTQFPWGFAAGGPSFQANVSASPGRSFSFEFVPGATAFGAIIDTRIPCLATGGGGLCGVLVTYADNNLLTVYTGTLSDQKTTQVTLGIVANRFNNVVVTEQRTGTSTLQLTVFVNGKPTVIPVAGGDVFGRVRDDVRLVANPNLFVDEYEFWQLDLTKTPEILCENGFDSEFDVASGTCLSTYGP